MRENVKRQINTTGSRCVQKITGILKIKFCGFGKCNCQFFFYVFEVRQDFHVYPIAYSLANAG